MQEHQRKLPHTAQVGEVCRCLKGSVNEFIAQLNLIPHFM
jgi:hypothetical protein